MSVGMMGAGNPSPRKATLTLIGEFTRESGHLSVRLMVVEKASRLLVI